MNTWWINDERMNEWHWKTCTSSKSQNSSTSCHRLHDSSGRIKQSLMWMNSFRNTRVVRASCGDGLQWKETRILKKTHHQSTSECWYSINQSNPVQSSPIQSNPNPTSFPIPITSQSNQLTRIELFLKTSLCQPFDSKNQLIWWGNRLWFCCWCWLHCCCCCWLHCCCWMHCCCCCWMHCCWCCWLHCCC